MGEYFSHGPTMGILYVPAPVKWGISHLLKTNNVECPAGVRGGGGGGGGGGLGVISSPGIDRAVNLLGKAWGGGGGFQVCLWLIS